MTSEPAALGPGARRSHGREADRPATGAVQLIGNVDLDIVLGPVRPWPRPGTETIVPSQAVRAGGAAGVAALALAALGVPLRLHASVGDDVFGELLRRELGAAGQQLAVARTSTAFSVGVTHPDGERTFLTHLGHLAQLDLPRVVEELEAAEPSLVLLCGYFLLPPLRGGAGRELARRARNAGHRVVFDSGWPSEGFTPEVRQELDELLPWLDLALPNEAEALAWTGAGDLEGALRQLERHGARAVVKRGAEGASWLEGGRVRTVAVPRACEPPEATSPGDASAAGAMAASRDEAPAPGSLAAAPGEGPSTASGSGVESGVDSVGAGDCFNAALVAGLRRADRLPSAIAGATGVALDAVDLGAVVSGAVGYASRVVRSSPRRYAPS